MQKSLEDKDSFMESELLEKHFYDVVIFLTNYFFEYQEHYSKQMNPNSTVDQSQMEEIIQNYEMVL